MPKRRDKIEIHHSGLRVIFEDRILFEPFSRNAQTVFIGLIDCPDLYALWPPGSGGLYHLKAAMANIDANKAKSTVFIGGLAQSVDESVLLQAFSPFGSFVGHAVFQECTKNAYSIGDVMEVQIPPAAVEGDRPPPGRIFDIENASIPF